MAIKTVRIYRVVVVDEHEVHGNPPSAFWDRLYSRFPAVSATEHGVHAFTGAGGVVLEGHFRCTPAGAPDYLYVGRSRNRLDWPDRKTRSSPGVTSVASDVNTTAILEPCRMKPIAGTPYVAVVRSYAGAQSGALQDWLSDAYSQLKPNCRIELVAFTREDQLLRLENALGVARLTVSLQDNVQANGVSQIERAAHDLQTAVGFPVRTEVTMSMGNNQSDSAIGAMKQVLRNVLQSGLSTRTEATLVEQTADGETAREIVNFISDKVAYPVVVHSNDVSDEEYIRVLDEGIREFRMGQRQLS